MMTEIYTEKEQEKMLEKSRRKAFLGLQIKYTLMPVLLLYGIVFALLLGMFLYHWAAHVSKAAGNVTFLTQLNVLPLDVAFIVLAIGVQMVLKIGFSKQRKNRLALTRIPLPEETKNLLRWSYSFLVTLSAFLIYFLMLSFLLVLENSLAPETAYGFAELYPAFSTFTHLYRVYPVANGMAWVVFPVVIANCSVIAPWGEEIQQEKSIKDAVWIGLALGTFLFYCFDTGNQWADFALMLLFSAVYIGRVLFAYRRRGKDDRAEFAERVE